MCFLFCFVFFRQGLNNKIREVSSKSKKNQCQMLVGMGIEQRI